MRFPEIAISIVETRGVKDQSAGSEERPGYQRKGRPQKAQTNTEPTQDVQCELLGEI